MFTRLVDVTLIGTGTECVDQQVSHPTTGGQRSFAQSVVGLRLIMSVLEVSEQPDQCVFVDPDVPTGPAVIRHIGA